MDKVSTTEFRSEGKWPYLTPT